jgi:hypothetical protein
MGSSPHDQESNLREINISTPFNANISEKSNSFIYNNISKDVNIENRSFISV